jgi:hypothetical protein
MTELLKEHARVIVTREDGNHTNVSLFVSRPMFDAIVRKATVREQEPNINSATGEVTRRWVGDVQDTKRLTVWAFTTEPPAD